MNYLKIHEDCKFVKGCKRSIIYDLGNEVYHFIPNVLCELANRFDKNPIDDIFSYYGKANEKYISEYLSFLINNHFAIVCPKRQCDIFQPINLTWNNPSKITNAIIEINPYFDYKFIFKQLEDLGCYYIQLRSAYTVEYEILNRILDASENTAIKSIDIILKYNNDIDVFKNLVERHQRLSSIILHSSPINKKYNEVIHFSLVKKQMNKPSDYVVTDLDFFNVNLPLFTESQNYNAYFNRKVAIDYKGNIKNCLSIDESYGNVKKKNIIEVLDNLEFKKYWTASKDKIQVCKDCEFRYMCIDARVPYKDENENWYFETECNYNPYIAQWKDKS